jgi:DNA recombination protein RmuC
MTQLMVKLIRERKPEVILTHDWNGEYGHNQHILTSRCMETVIKAAADPALYPELGEAWQVQKLYRHLEKKGAIEFDWHQSFPELGGRTLLQTADQAMKENASSHLETTTKLSEQLKNAVKEMQEKTSDVGRKADTLSEALTGKPKVQGCFGENFLEAILAGEGLEEGKHYSREAANEDQSRPDFVFHFKEGLEQKDLIVDSKVSLTAFVDYMNGETDEEKAAALDRHIRSVRKHIDELARKEYAKKNSRSFADYVLMFMPRDMAFRVALEADPMLWQEAYKKGVLIATEQTIMPFLKIMQLTWNKFQHDTNTQRITQAAQNMIDRVGSFYDSYAELGRKLKAVFGEYNKGVAKLQDNGQSITTSARQVISLGVRRSKGKEFLVPEETLEAGE